jgi:hypothetical protein
MKRALTDPSQLNFVAEWDRLAGRRSDTHRPAGVGGIVSRAIDIAPRSRPATRLCVHILMSPGLLFGLGACCGSAVLVAPKIARLWRHR